MNNFSKTFFTAGLCATLALSGCTSDFGSINTDRNNPTEVTADLLLLPIMHTFIMDQFNYGDGAALAHQLSRTNYNETEQYAFGTNESTWSRYYLQLNDIQDMYNVARKNGQPSCQAIALIWKAFAIAQLTDLWGDVPYFEATQGGNNITPAYDTQEDIYTADNGIIDLLKQAEEMLSTSNDVIPSDLVYGGDRLRWRKFGNSLRLRYLMRISNRIGESALDIKGEIAAVMALPLMDANEDNMLLPFLSGAPNRCPIYDMRAGNFEYTRMSTEMARMWSQYADPRIPVWFAPTTNSALEGTAEYNGVLAACSSTTLTNIGYSQADVSMLGSYYRDAPDACSAILMNCSEVKFLQAEAIARGYAAGDMQTLYEDGIRLSMEYYGVTLTDEYLQQPGIAFDATQALQQIMLQKWMSLFMVGYESWFDFLRTGLPQQDDIIDNRNPTAAGEIPSRFYYPSDEQALNTANYEEAINRHGGEDNINTELWWE